MTATGKPGDKARAATEALLAKIDATVGPPTPKPAAA